MRWLRQEEKGATRPLWEEMFPEDSASFLDYYYREKAPEAEISAEEAEGRLVSMIHWNPYPLWVRGRRWDSRYLVAVATSPAFRHQGRMAEQLRQGLARWRRQRMPFVWLVPAKEAIYRPFGFRTVSWLWRGTRTEAGGSAGEALSAAKPPEPGAGRSGGEAPLTVRPLEPEEDAWAAAFWMRQLAGRFSLFPERNAAYMARLRRETASEGGGVAVLEQGGTPVGVFAFWPAEAGIEVREMALEPGFLPDFLRLGQAETALWGRRRQAVGEAVAAYLRQGCGYPAQGPVTLVNTGWLGERQPYAMARIVCLEAFLEGIRSPREKTLCLRVEDPLLPENQGTFRWRLGPEGSRMEPAAWEAPELSLGIEALGQWLLGGQAPSGYEETPDLAEVFFTEIV